jgi:TolB protein
MEMRFGQSLMCSCCGIVLSILSVAAQTPLLTPRELVPVSNEESSWSPDGKKMAFDSNRGDGKHYNVYVVDIAVSTVTRLTNSTANDITPSWSPDGRRLAFTSDRTGHNEIYVMNADGSGVRQLTHDNSDDIHPSWSRDGKMVIFCSAFPNPEQSKAVEGERYEIFEVALDTGKIRQITDFGGVNTFPDYSPDGRLIAFRKLLPEKNSEVWVMDSDGKNPRNLTNNPAFDGWPAWAPDGERILFGSNRGGADYNIFVMRSDGSNVQQLTTLHGRCTSPKWFPDGSKVTFDHALDGRCAILTIDLK